MDGKGPESEIRDFYFRFCRAFSENIGRKS